MAHTAMEDLDGYVAAARRSAPELERDDCGAISHSCIQGPGLTRGSACMSATQRHKRRSTSMEGAFTIASLGVRVSAHRIKERLHDSSSTLYFIVRNSNLFFY
jgi:hypothetical protein